MLTWPRTVVVLISALIVLVTQHASLVEVHDCSGGYTVTFQLNGEVQHPKTCL
jgi:hypothetical protein